MYCIAKQVPVGRAAAPLQARKLVWVAQPSYGVYHTRRRAAVSFITDIMPELQSQTEEQIMRHWPSVKRLVSVKTTTYVEPEQ